MTVIRRNQASLAQLAADRLAVAREAAVAEINAWAAQERLAYITVMPGQEMIYMAKEAEARAWLADPAPEMAAYPLLAAEVGITAPDAYQLAQLWVNLAALWRVASARIEGERLSRIKGVALSA